MNDYLSRPGAMLLIIVLIAGAASLILGLSIALRGIDELEMGYRSNQSQEVLALAEGCVDEALLRLSRNPLYAGGTLPYGDGSCSVAVAANGSNRRIEAGATIGQWTRTVGVTVDMSASPMKIMEWEYE